MTSFKATAIIAGFAAMSAIACTPTADKGLDVANRGVDDWGPLAVLDDEDKTTVDLAHGGTGTLVITADCAFLRLSSAKGKKSGIEKTLGWRSGQITWDANAEGIRFDDPVAGKMRIKDGDPISVGGGGKLADGNTWLSEPAEACPTQRFYVHSIKRER